MDCKNKSCNEGSGMPRNPRKRTSWVAYL